MAERSTFSRGGTHLAYIDFGGEGPPALLLHGSASHAGAWRETASWLSNRYRVVALDQRGHGQSERRPNDLSRAAYVEDAAALVDELDDGSAVVIGHSLGGHTALLLACAYPELVSALVVAEATPGQDIAAGVATIDWLRSWPLPFPTLEDAAGFVGGPVLRRQAWVDDLESLGEGWYPRFDQDVIEAALAEIDRRPHWREWGRVRCPALLVRGEAGFVAPTDTKVMADQHGAAEVIEIPGAGHDVHLEQPLRWRTAVSDFLAAVDPLADMPGRAIVVD